MNYSGYQIETVLRQLRRLRGMLLAGIEGPAGRDRVSLSEQGREQSHTVRLLEPGEVAPVRRTVREIRDDTRYPPPVERELERRADSFLDGELPRERAPSPIPKLRRPTS